MGRLFAIITAAMVLFWAGRVPADVVKVGLLADFTGAFATWGPQFQEGVEAYQALYGKTVKGPDDKPHEIQFIYRDTASQFHSGHRSILWPRRASSSVTSAGKRPSMLSRPG